MKFIIAVIQPGKLDAVKEALSAVDVVRLTVVDCQGFGRTRGHQPAYMPADRSMQLLPKVQLQIAVNDAFVDPTVAAIESAAKDESLSPDGTAVFSQAGDGKIFVLPMEDCIRIRTGERGGEAI